MKRTFVLAGAAVVMLSTPALAAMDPQIENALIAVCKASISNKPFVLSGTLKEHRLSYPVVADKLVCNGQSVYNFAMDRGADRTAAQIFSRGRMGVVTIEDLSKTASNTDWSVSF
ncbi:DUF3718 domain-containing protein [Gallaecimonas pentaromativorans]|uniref:Uncharacterized protein DUF3718 n=1 Tax=Gallaecimonas pentaromativorans TaxID=584787 RepID=A0A3N1PBP3_9GAMM|nr:DUF3718 domain-containing protein [Gallaecimonas pentaromativorans]MED5525178.1 DUF3718 domain-containing protein [Pseudomonadota bacterium]ROQ25983.1 uncharacterized protein DUF3718 [Gallaecimonas pentaromativorans]